jgi:hypothetical protein
VRGTAWSSRSRASAPARLDAEDNLSAGFKAVRDGIADALEVNDRHPRLRWFYGQERGGPRVYGARVLFETMSVDQVVSASRRAKGLGHELWARHVVSRLRGLGLRALCKGGPGEQGFTLRRERAARAARPGPAAGRAHREGRAREPRRRRLPLVWRAWRSAHLRMRGLQSARGDPVTDEQWKAFAARPKFDVDALAEPPAPNFTMGPKPPPRDDETELFNRTPEEWAGSDGAPT